MVIPEIIEICRKALAGTLIEKFHDFYFKTLSSSRVYQYAILEKSFSNLQWREWLSDGPGKEREKEIKSIAYFAAIERWFHASVTGTSPAYLDFESNKKAVSETFQNATLQLVPRSIRSF